MSKPQILVLAKNTSICSNMLRHITNDASGFGPNPQISDTNCGSLLFHTD